MFKHEFLEAVGIVFNQFTADNDKAPVGSLIDDLGYNGISSFGGTHMETPHIDSIANDGVKFTHAYASSQFSPSRAAFLSGQYGGRTNFTAVAKEFRDLRYAPCVQPDPVRTLPFDLYNVGKMFRDAGYKTGLSGKWHVDKYEKENESKLGTEEYYGRYGFTEVKTARPEVDPKKIFSVNNAGIQFIEEATHENKPFFLYMAHHAVHADYEARDDLIQKYADLGYPTEDPKAKKFPAQLLGMTEELDNSIGILLAKVKDLSIEDNTIVVFMSDNGARNKSWDHAPLRMGKGSIHDGGIRVPLIVKWPNNVNAGSSCDIPVHIVDLYPTFMEMVGGSVPENHILDGESLVPLLTDSTDFKERAVFVHHPHYVPNYHKTPATMIRHGDYKLIHFYGDKLDDVDASKLIPGERYELYNLVVDPSESNDLAQQMPEKLEQLKAELDQWRTDVEAQVPTPNPNTDLSQWKVDFKKLAAQKESKAPNDPRMDRMLRLAGLD